MTFVCIIDESYPEVAAQEPKLTKEEAIAVAYKNLLQESKEVLVNYDKKEEHQVEACLDVWKGKLIWDVKIEGIKARLGESNNDLYDKSFHFKIDAITGEVYFMGQNK
ncbi:MAG: PepSY domain-containing protein [Caldicoprobacter oshimai]|uniref:Peptidase propeptide and YPEB domain-containing protein n=1 Tax=Caldicoprobacter faecalis TaxID=937334 RepID=A0A1I5XWV6_9FIRM|nr:PepSY domain-containing protein [Caldicoprobacter faecalis]PZN12123.1 MAG: hypothetical protein DIU64_00565 [Caldicoprobacter oshimai]SFQ36461.1 hypothetical protein SAMN05444406_1322 [Caldicoprobacter faecalis]